MWNPYILTPSAAPSAPPLPSFHSGLLTESPALCCCHLLSPPQFSPHSGNGGCDYYKIDLCFHQASSWPLCCRSPCPMSHGICSVLFLDLLWHLTPLATPWGRWPLFLLVFPFLLPCILFLGVLRSSPGLEFLLWLTTHFYHHQASLWNLRSVSNYLLCDPFPSQTRVLNFAHFSPFRLARVSTLGKALPKSEA